MGIKEVFRRCIELCLETLGDMLNHVENSVGAVRVMVEIAGCGKVLEVRLEGAAVVKHVGPGTISDRFSIPEKKVFPEDRFLGQDLVGQVDHLLGGEADPACSARCWTKSSKAFKTTSTGRSIENIILYILICLLVTC
jgi:hypothetical protein